MRKENSDIKIETSWIQRPRQNATGQTTIVAVVGASGRPASVVPATALDSAVNGPPIPARPIKKAHAQKETPEDPSLPGLTAGNEHLPSGFGGERGMSHQPGHKRLRPLVSGWQPFCLTGNACLDDRRPKPTPATFPWQAWRLFYSDFVGLPSPGAECATDQQMQMQGEMAASVRAQTHQRSVFPTSGHICLDMTNPCHRRGKALARSSGHIFYIF